MAHMETCSSYTQRKTNVEGNLEDEIKNETEWILKIGPETKEKFLTAVEAGMYNSYIPTQTPDTGLRHPSSNHCHS